MTVKGTEMGSSNQPLTEDTELWARNPVECVQALLDNPDLKNHFAYAPVKHFAIPNDDGDSDGMETDTAELRDDDDNRLFSETCTGDWWWETQVR